MYVGVWVGEGGMDRREFQLKEETSVQGTHPTDLKLCPLCCFFSVFLILAAFKL